MTAVAFTPLDVSGLILNPNSQQVWSEFGEEPPIREEPNVSFTTHS